MLVTVLDTIPNISIESENIWYRLSTGTASGYKNGNNFYLDVSTWRHRGSITSGWKEEESCTSE